MSSSTHTVTPRAMYEYCDHESSPVCTQWMANSSSMALHRHERVANVPLLVIISVFQPNYSLSDVPVIACTGLRDSAVFCKLYSHTVKTTLLSFTTCTMTILT